MSGKILLGIMLIVLIALSMYTVVPMASTPKPLYVIFVWHYHQPWYLNENNTYFILPWVRMHSVGNYYKMAYILSKHPDIKATFDFSGSLIVQLQLYLKGVMDERQIISWKIANGTKLSIDEKFSMLQIPGGFFDINWKRIVDKVPRYSQLRDKAMQVLQKYRSLPTELYKEKVVESFTEQDYIDLAALFNLFWIDPEVLHDEYPNLYKLYEQALTDPNMHFTRQQVAEILKAQISIMSKILPIYRELLEKGQAEIIPVPYSHPLAPILTDFGWTNDLDLHIIKSLQLFKQVFNETPRGVWPAEEAVNEYVVREFSKYFNWTVTDESILAKSGVKTSEPSNILRPWYIDFNGKKIYIFFRNTELSNLISFTYSNMDPKQAAQDLINRLLSLEKYSDGKSVVVIALDGENPWEWYEHFGDTFLNTLYSLLSEYQQKGLLITTTPIEYLKKFTDEAKPLPLGTHYYLDLKGRDISDFPVSYFEDGYSALPRKPVKSHIAEGSWAGGELAIWIGQRQENAAWMLLAKARDDLFKILGVSNIFEAEKKNPKAVEYLLRAEASDWFWWYGGDTGGTFPANPLFKAYLRGVYDSLGVKPPSYLLTVFNPDATPIGTINSEPPKPLKSIPKIDGVIESNEWSSSMNMSVGLEFVKNIFVAVDPNNLYLCIVPVNESVLSMKDLSIGIYLTNWWRSVSPFHPGYNSFPRYQDKDLGMGLFYEIMVYPSNKTAIVSVADGKGGWIPLFTVQDIAIKNVIELKVPWNFLSLRGGDYSYITEATYYNKKIVETATRLGLVYMLQVPKQTGAPTGKVIFDMKDPIGDDNGLGTYSYPTNDVFKPGVFDLVRFRVIDTGSKLVFQTFVRNLGDNPWKGPNGFCLQYVQIYVHTMKGPYATYTFGLNVNISKPYAWSFALLLAPGWGNDPVPKGQKAALYYPNKTYVVQDDKFKVYADPSQNAIIAEVDKSLLPDTKDEANWSYIVVVTSYDGYGPDRIRPFGVKPQEWVVGVGLKYAEAIVKNVIPRIMDLLAPTAQLQYKILSSFKIYPNGTAVPAELIGFSASSATVQPTVTKTLTQTTTTTMTKTITQTTTYTTTKIRIETTTKTTTTPSPTTITKTEYQTPSTAYIAAIILFIIGLIIGYLIKRHR